MLSASVLNWREHEYFVLRPMGTELDRQKQRCRKATNEEVWSRDRWMKCPDTGKAMGWPRKNGREESPHGVCVCVQTAAGGQGTCSGAAQKHKGAALLPGKESKVQRAVRPFTTGSLVWTGQLKIQGWKKRTVHHSKNAKAAFQSTLPKGPKTAAKLQSFKKRLKDFVNSKPLDFPIPTHNCSCRYSSWTFCR